MQKRIKQIAIVVVVLGLLANLVILNVWVLRLNVRVLKMREQLAIECTPADRPAYDEAALFCESQRWEWWWKDNCYVSDRPDLSEPVGRKRLHQLRSEATKYLEASGLEASDARDLQFARSDSGMIVRFYLSPEDLSRFLVDKRQLKGSATRLLSTLYDTGHIVVEYAEDHKQGKMGDLPPWAGLPNERSYIQEYPFVRLTWWPINLIDAENMTAYEGYVFDIGNPAGYERWRTTYELDMTSLDASVPFTRPRIDYLNGPCPGSVQLVQPLGPLGSYFVFVDENTGLVYVIGR